MKRRILAWLLLCVMLAGSMTVPVWAEEGNAETPPASSEPAESTPPPASSEPAESTPPPASSEPAESTPPPESSEPAESTPPPESSEPPESTEPSECTHSWDYVTILEKADCKNEGKNILVCSKCRAEKIVTTAKTNDHTYSYKCDSDCNVCGGIRDVVHTWSAKCDSVCDVCEEEREVTHTPNSSWAKKAGGHYHICTVCGDALEMQDHYPGPAATEDKDQICLTCGYVMTRKKGHTHAYSNKYTHDQTGHWYACSGCAEKKGYAQHSFQDTCSSVCEDCGYEITPQHDYHETWTSDDTGHWKVCAGCHQTSEVQEHIPGEPATESRPQLCTECGFELAPRLVPDGEAMAGEDIPWQIDDNSHWVTGPDGEKQNEAFHTWDQGVDRWDGSVLYSCKVCGAQRAEGKSVTETAETGNGIRGPVILLIVLIVLFVAAASVLVIILIISRRKNSKYSGKYNR